MKLVEATIFGTNHKNFLDFLIKENIELNSAWTLFGEIVPNKSKEKKSISITIDYGNPGKSIGDVKLIIEYNKISGNFTLLDIKVRFKKEK